MRLSDVEKKARKAGVKDTWKYSKKDLIRQIQRLEGNFQCFGTAINFCDQTGCCWKLDCIIKK